MTRKFIKCNLLIEVMICSRIVHDVFLQMLGDEYIISVAHSLYMAEDGLSSPLLGHTHTLFAFPWNYFSHIRRRRMWHCDTKCQGRINFMWMLVIINLNDFGHFQNAKSLISEILTTQCPTSLRFVYVCVRRGMCTTRLSMSRCGFTICHG